MPQQTNGIFLHRNLYTKQLTHETWANFAHPKNWEWQKQTAETGTLRRKARKNGVWIWWYDLTASKWKIFPNFFQGPSRWNFHSSSVKTSLTWWIVDKQILSVGGIPTYLYQSPVDDRCLLHAWLVTDIVVRFGIRLHRFRFPTGETAGDRHEYFINIPVSRAVYCIASYNRATKQIWSGKTTVNPTCFKICKDPKSVSEN